METIYERVTLIIKNERVNYKELALILGNAENTISMKACGQRKWSIEDIQKISSRFVKYSHEWILLGTGSMFRTESTNNAIATGDNNIQVSGNGSSVGVNNELVDMLRHQLEVKDKQIEMLMDKIK